MQCRNCDSSEFDEWNGILWCRQCNTQSGSFITVDTEAFTDGSKFIGLKELTEKRKRLDRSPQKTGVLWTTTQAFNLILSKQISIICKHLSARDGCNPTTTKRLMRLIWLAYLKKSELAFHSNSDIEPNGVFPLHPKSRFRDLQILRFGVDSLPAFKNAMSDRPRDKCLYKLGADGVMRSVENYLFDDNMEWIDEDLEESHLKDEFTHFYRDPRTYLKSKAMKRTEQILLKSMEGIDLEIPSAQELSQTDSKDLSTIDGLSEQSNDSIISDTYFETKDEIDDKDISFQSELDEFDDYEKELLKNAPKLTKSLAKMILKRKGFTHLKESDILITRCGFYFMELMSLFKTLAILNLVCRLQSLDMYCFDLIRWVNERHIPYKYCFSYLPKDWLFISNDFHTFSSHSSPSARSISILSAKLANYVGIKRFPSPDLTKLLDRLVKDLNLPKDIVWLIDSEYNLSEHLNCLKGDPIVDGKQQLPIYESLALMSIVMVLRRLFDWSDQICDNRTKTANGLFIWTDWLKYSRLRLDLIESYSSPLYEGDLEDIRDIDLLCKISAERTQSMGSFGRNKKSLFKDNEHLKNVQSLVHRIWQKEVIEEEIPTLEPSLYPLTNATNYALTRLSSDNSSETSKKMSIDFYGSTRISGWLCAHRKPFHRRYHFLNRDPKYWSSNFRLIMKLVSFISNSKIKDLINVFKVLEKAFFVKETKRNKRLSIR